jgi:uridine kinase
MVGRRFNPLPLAAKSPILPHMMIDAGAALSIAAQHTDLRLVAIDGLPLAGKSTLAERFVTAMGAQCIYLDDFVKPQAQWRSPHVPAFPFDYIRYDEFLGAVQALARGDAARYRLYDWSAGALADDAREVRPDGLVVIEGVSSLHPDLAPLYDLRFWVESDPAAVLAASFERGAAGWEREWRELFLPSTELYMRTKPRDRADYHVAGRGAGR